MSEKETAGATLSLEPLLLGGLFRAIGTPDVPLLAMSEAQRRYVHRDLRHWASYWGVPFRWPSRFPVRTVAALRLFLAAADEPEAAAWPLCQALFCALWVADRDLADEAVLEEVAGEVGLDGAALLATSRSAAIKEKLRRRTDRAAARGIFGVPTFVVGEELYLGQDRLDFVARALAGAPP